MSYRNRNSRIFVGNLPLDIREKDIEDLFYKHGKISNIDLINKTGTPFAFLQFENLRDAEDAVNAKNGYNYSGYKLRVEFPKSRRRRIRSSRSRSRSRSSRRSQGPSSTRSLYGVLVSGLPLSGSWQDLKDHMREAGNICYASVHRDGTGTVEFERYEDMKYAVNKLDDSKFRSHEGEISYVKVKEIDHFRYPSRSYSPEQIRSPTMFSEEFSPRFASRSTIFSIPNRGIDALMLPQYSQYSEL